MQISIRPVGKKILVKKLPSKEYTFGDIVVPENAMSNLGEAEVEWVSDEVKHLYKPGDVILYHAKKGYLEPRLTVDHLWLDAEPNLGEIWGVLEKKQIQDKGDDL